MKSKNYMKQKEMWEKKNKIAYLMIDQIIFQEVN